MLVLDFRRKLTLESGLHASGLSQPFSKSMGPLHSIASQWLFEHLACPSCHQAVRAQQDGEALRCQGCGDVGRTALGIPDFLAHRKHLDAASAGTFDLEQDTAAALKLQEASERLTFRELEALAVELREGDDDIDLDSKTAKRFNEKYAEVQDEVGLRAGEATFNRIDAYFEGLGRPHVSGGIALEAGGGHGLFLPDFSRRFDTVVLLDCSLVNIIVARKLAMECGLDNVSFVRADATALPFRSSSFDFIHEDNVIEHVADPDSLVTEAVRVTRPSGTYVCLSPNRYSLAPEPHFRLPCFGFFPRSIRRPLIHKLRGVRTEQGTDPRSLRQLRRYLTSAGVSDAHIFFLPRQLRRTARNTFFRRLVRASLAAPIFGALVSSTINGPLLGLMPYHVALVSGREKRLSSSSPTGELTSSFDPIAS